MPKKRPWLAELEGLLEAGEEARFYDSRAWRRLRREVLRLDSNECQRCKSLGRYRRGAIVHHVQHLADRPDLALSIWDPETGERQLVTVCKDCHEALHPESLRQFRVAVEPVTAERWD